LEILYNLYIRWINAIISHGGRYKFTTDTKVKHKWRSSKGNIISLLFGPYIIYLGVNRPLSRRNEDEETPKGDKKSKKKEGSP
jgi:hypothetical protein